MKIKVIKCSSPIFWYSNKIGQEYEVEKSPYYGWDYVWYDDSELDHNFKACDVEVLKDDEREISSQVRPPSMDGLKESVKEMMEIRKGIQGDIMKVKIRFRDASQAKEFSDVLNTYQKGDFYCIYRSNDTVKKYPIDTIFDIDEDYSK